MILVDAGPLVAFVDEDDQYHQVCASALRGVREPMATLWPSVAEAMYLLLALPHAQQALLEMMERGGLLLLAVDAADVPRMRALMEQYADLPMDLADAALIRVAEREGIRTIFTLDRRDFSVYRLHGRVRPKLIP